MNVLCLKTVYDICTFCYPSNVHLYLWMMELFNKVRKDRKGIRIFCIPNPLTYHWLNIKPYNCLDFYISRLQVIQFPLVIKNNILNYFSDESQTKRVYKPTLIHLVGQSNQHMVISVWISVWMTMKFQAGILKSSQKP